MLNKLKWKFARFMSGRYGIDQLYVGGGILFIVLQVLQLIFNIPLLNILSLILVVWLFYRVFSRNISARRNENQKYLRFTGTMKAKIRKVARRLKDIRSHRYRECPECETILRLPRKRGTHNTRCPNCNCRFQVTIRL